MYDIHFPVQFLPTSFLFKWEKYQEKSKKSWSVAISTLAMTHWRISVCLALICLMAKFDLSAGQNELASIDEEEAGQVWSLTDFFYFWTIDL